MNEEYLKYLGELYLKYRMALEDNQRQIAQKDALIDHLKSELLNQKKQGNTSGTVAT